MVSQQCGAAILIKRMEQRGEISLGPSTPSLPTVTWLELYRTEDDSQIFSAGAGWDGSKLVEAVEFKDRSVEDLIAWLGKYPTARTFHIASSGKPVPTPTVTPTPVPVSDLPVLTRILRWGVKGDDVKALQRALNSLSFNVGTPKMGILAIKLKRR